MKHRYFVHNFIIIIIIIIIITIIPCKCGIEPPYSMSYEATLLLLLLLLLLSSLSIIISYYYYITMGWGKAPV